MPFRTKTWIVLITVLLLTAAAHAGAALLEVREPSVPAAPEIISVSAPTGDSVLVTWRAGREGGLLGYYVFRAVVPNGVFLQVNEELVPEDQTIYRDTGLVPGRTYVYFLVAVGPEGETSAPSNSEEVYVGPDVAVDIIPGESALMRGETVYQGIVLKALNDLDVPAGLQVTVRLDGEAAEQIDVSLYPGAPVILGPDRPVAMVRLGITARATTLPGMYEAEVQVSGRDASGIDVSRTQPLFITVADVSGRRSAVVLGARSYAGRVGQAVPVFGRLVPPPQSNGTVVSLRVRPGCGEEENIIEDVAVNARGYFVSEFEPDKAGIHCVTAFWKGDAWHDPSESSAVVIGVFEGTSRITCNSTLSYGATEGDFFGVVHPAPPDGTPVTLTFLFAAHDGNLRFTHEITTYTGRFDPQQHPGSYLEHVDLASLFQGMPVAGYWYVTASWDGITDRYQGARSESLYVPFMRPEPGRVVIVAAGMPESDPGTWAAHSRMAEFALDSMLARGFQRSWITYLSADSDDPDADGIATADAIRNAVEHGGAGGDVPLIFYIVGPTGHRQDSGETWYVLNRTGETLNGDRIREALDRLPPDTAQIILLDGNKTGYLIGDICREGLYRNILSFSGMGNTPVLFRGDVALSKMFFTTIRQGRNLRESITGLFQLLASIRPAIPISLPMVEIGGFPGRPSVADCIANEKSELDPLNSIYLGFGHEAGMQAPELTGISEYQIGDKYAGETLGCIPAGGDKMSDTTGGFVIWVHFDDPEEEMNGEPQSPLMAMVDPEGRVSEYFSDAFRPRPGGGFEVELPPSLFRVEGTYNIFMFQVDALQNLSGAGTTAVTVVNVPPKVLMFGFAQTSLTTSGGDLRIQALVLDRNGAADIRDVSLTYEGSPFGLCMKPVVRNGLYGFYETYLDLNGYALNPAMLLLGLDVIDGSGVTVHSDNILQVR